MKKTLAPLLLSIVFAVNQAYAEERGLFNELFGTTIYTGGGSSGLSYFGVASIKSISAQKVELGLMSTFSAFTDNGFSFADEDKHNIRVHYVMLNCETKTYAPEVTENETNFDYKAFHQGSLYKWGDYYEVFSISENTIGAEGIDKINNLFEKACKYAKRF